MSNQPIALAPLRTACLALAIGTAAVVNAQTSTPTTAASVMLKPGDPAPALAVGKWLKGDPVKAFEPGMVYVVECWATWCGPCIAAIPHVSDLQKKHEGKLVVIGMNVFEQDDAKVEPFVASMGDKMSYRVATDDKSTSPDGAMATTWLAAAGRDSIPTSFVVDQHGKIAWIGHPMEMEPVLDQVLAGTFDPAAAEAHDAQKKAAIAKINAASRAKDTDAALSAIDELAKLDPSMAGQLDFARFQFLMQGKRYDDGYAAAAKLLARDDVDANSLARVAAVIAMAPGVERRDLTLARKFAERAVAASKRSDGPILDLLAHVAFDQGEREVAVATEQEAIARAKTPNVKSQMEQTLARFQAPTTVPATPAAKEPVIQ